MTKKLRSKYNQSMVLEVRIVITLGNAEAVSKKGTRGCLD